MANVDSASPMMNLSMDSFANSSSSSEENVEEKLITQQFIKIITTFASKVDISVCKAQGTIDVLLAQYNLPLSPKEVTDENVSKIKGITTVVRRAVTLQKDVERLGQVLVSRNTQSSFVVGQQRANYQRDLSLAVPQTNGTTTEEARISPRPGNQTPTPSSVPSPAPSPTIAPGSAPGAAPNPISTTSAAIPASSSPSSSPITSPNASPAPSSSPREGATGFTAPTNPATSNSIPSPRTPPTAQPATAQPAMAQPATAQPATAQPATAQPATAQPATAPPATAQPATAQPATAQPATAQPATAQPATAQPPTAAPTFAPPPSHPLTSSLPPSSSAKASPSLLAKSLSTPVIPPSSIPQAKPASKAPPPKQYMVPVSPGTVHAATPISPPTPYAAPSSTVDSPPQTTPASPSTSHQKVIGGGAGSIKKVPVMSRIPVSSPSLTGSFDNPKQSNPIPVSPRTQSTAYAAPFSYSSPQPYGSPLSSTPPVLSKSGGGMKSAPAKKASAPPAANAFFAPSSAPTSSPLVVNGSLSPGAPKRPARAASNSTTPNTSTSPPSRTPPMPPVRASIAISHEYPPNDTEDSSHPSSDAHFDSSDDSSTTPPSHEAVDTEAYEQSTSPPVNNPLDGPTSYYAPQINRLSDDLNDIDLDDDDEDDSFVMSEKDIKKKKKADKNAKFNTVNLKKDIFALMDEIDREEAAPPKRLNPVFKEILSPFFSKRPKNKQEMETKLKAKGIVPKDMKDSYEGKLDGKKKKG